jgi:hypothetical protein
MEVSDARRLKPLEGENRCLKKIVADLTLDITALEDVLSKNVVSPARRRRESWQLARFSHRSAACRRTAATRPGPLLPPDSPPSISPA